MRIYVPPSLNICNTRKSADNIRILHINILSVKVRMTSDIFSAILSTLKHQNECAIRTSTDNMLMCNIIMLFALLRIAH